MTSKRRERIDRAIEARVEGLEADRDALEAQLTALRKGLQGEVEHLEQLAAESKNLAGLTARGREVAWRLTANRLQALLDSSGGEG